MNLTENPVLFTVVNKNNCEIYYELVPLDKVLAKMTSDKAVEILTAVKHNEILPRVAITLIIFCVKDASLEAVVGKNPNKFSLSGEIECIGVNIMRVLPFDNTKSSMSASELVEEISKKVPRQVQIDILRETFPQGKVTGDLFTIGSTSGESGKSRR